MTTLTQHIHHTNVMLILSFN
uniref:Uncharacterized protein n=1 Tax=Arundo donax TaxID=35708 RepID=A0A0A9BNK5_ARUDO